MKDYSYDPNKTFKVPTFTNAAGQQQIYSVYQEIYDIVMNDSWASISLWGKRGTPEYQAAQTKQGGPEQQ